jgi:hypothetical protein
MTEQEIKDLVEKGWQEDELRMKLHKLVGSELRRWDGKKLTAPRFVTNLEKKHPDLTFCLDRNYGMWHLDVWGLAIGLTHSERLQVFICYDSNRAEFNFSLFDENDAPNYRGVIERQRKRGEFLDRNGPKLVARHIEKFKREKALLDEHLGASFNNPEYYDIKKAAGLD